MTTTVNDTPNRTRYRWSTRHKFYAIVLVAAIVPLACFSLWLAFGAERAAVAVLQAQVDSAAAGAADHAGREWFKIRGDVLLLANNEPVAAALTAADPRQPEFLTSIFPTLDEGIRNASFYDAQNRLVWSLTRDPAIDATTFGSRATPIAPSQFIQVTVPIQPVGERALGRLVVGLATRALLPDTGAALLAGGTINAIDGSSGKLLLAPSFPEALVQSGTATVDRELWVVAKRPLEEPPLTIILAARGDAYIEPFRRAARAGIITVLLIAFFVMLLTVALTNRLTRSLTALAQASERISGGDLKTRVNVSSSDETGRVAAAFNTMAESLDSTLQQLATNKSLAAVGSYAAQMSHEVRNALTSIRADLQRAQEEKLTPALSAPLVDRALANVARLDGIITGSLRVARSGAVPQSRLSLATTIEAAVDLTRHEFTARHHTVTFHPLDGDPQVNGNAGALQQVWTNLLLNAAQANGDAVIHLAASADTVDVEIRDNGDGLQTAAFHGRGPFYSTKPSGTGLGLQITRQIIESHQGTLVLESRAGATVARVTLPVVHQ